MAELVFIGTGSGKAAVNRFHSSILLKSGNYSVLVDAGDSASRALLNSGTGYNEITGIIITHAHSDHICGLPLLLTQMKMCKRTAPLSVYCLEPLLTPLCGFLEFCYIFPDRLGFQLNLIPVNAEEIIEIETGFCFRFFQNTHLDKYARYNKTGSVSLASGSVLFSVSGKEVLFTGDLGGDKDFEIFSGLKPDFLISEVSHVSIDAIKDFIIKARPARTFLTHIDDETDSEILLKAKKEREDITEAEDGMILNLE